MLQRSFEEIRATIGAAANRAVTPKAMIMPGNGAMF